MKIAMYTRVSTHHQIDKDSLPLQKQDLINYAKFALNCEDYEIFEDAGFSAKNTDRPEYQKMMNKIRNNEFTHLLVWKIDRISRNLLDFCDMYNELKEHNCTFISRNEQFNTSSAMGEAMLKIILVFAELERKLTGERVKAIMYDRASKGKWNGAPIPLGYKWNDKIKFPEIDDNEAATVKLIFEKYAELKTTFGVKELLNTNKIKTKRNGSWTTKTISDVLRNVFYIGTYRYNYRNGSHGKIKDEKEWIIVENNHSAIISKELFKKCNNILDENAKRNSALYRANSKVHVFAGLIMCGECGHNFNAKQDKARNDGFRPSIYTCKGRYDHLGCTQKTISESIVGTFCFNFIRNIINLSNMLDKYKITENAFEKKLISGSCFNKVIGISNITEIYNAYQGIVNNNYKIKTSGSDNVINIDIELLNKNKSKFERALTRLDDLYLFDDNAMSEKDYIIKKNSITEKLKEINDKLKNTSSNTQSDNILIDKMLFTELSKILKDEINYRKMIDDIGREKLKEFVNELFSSITVKDKKILNIKLKNELEINFIYAE